MCLWLINHQPGAIVHQPIVQLFGFDSFYQETILINGTHRWPIVQGLFKVKARWLSALPLSILLSSQIYVELKPGDNSVHLSTSVSELTFTLIFCPESNAPMTVRLGSISPSDHSQIPLEHICKQFLFLTKLVRCTFDEILCKQLGSTRSLLFHIEKKFHHLTMSEHELAPDSTNQDIFKEIYEEISTTDLIEDPSVKLIVHSSIAPSNTFAYSQCSSFFSNFNKNVLAVFIRSDPAYKNVVVLNFPERFQHLPASFDEFYQILQTVKYEEYVEEVGGRRLLFSLEVNLCFIWLEPICMSWVICWVLTMVSVQRRRSCLLREVSLRVDKTSFSPVLAYVQSS